MRVRRAWFLVGALLIGLAIAPIVAAPGVPRTCAAILDLAGRAGEPNGADEREACEAHYAQLRSNDGVGRWAWRSWCTRWARSIADAGEC